jgi:hypothetical protein
MVFDSILRVFRVLYGLFEGLGGSKSLLIETKHAKEKKILNRNNYYFFEARVARKRKNTHICPKRS